MLCPICTFENQDGVRFCAKCAAPLQQAPPPAPATRTCWNCGHANIPAASYCQNCGAALNQPRPGPLPPAPPSPPPASTPAAPTAPPAVPQRIGWGRLALRFGLWTLGAYVVTRLVLTAVGIVQTLYPLTGTATEEADAMALALVREHYPQLADAPRTVYTATIDGTDYYVVEFVREREGPDVPPEGARILVDRLLRAAFLYEYIYGGSEAAAQPVADQPAQALSPEEDAHLDCETITYVVQVGETLGAIADYFGVSPEMIMDYSLMTEAEVTAGQELIIPLCS